jgi:predicted metal-dependent hydrolase
MSSNIEKELDFADYDKDEPEEDKVAAKAVVNDAAAKVAKAADAKEKRFQTALAEKAAAEAAQKEIDDILAKLSRNDKGRIRAAMGVVAVPLQAPSASMITRPP